jgi:non-ribosomal peptide synthetase component F
MQPIEYALWQHEKPIADERGLAYWSRQLKGASFDVDLPTDRPRPAALSGRGDVLFFSVPGDLRTRIETYARRHGMTPYAVTTAAFSVLLSRLSGRQDIVISVPHANRKRRAHENMVASVAVSFPLRIWVTEAESFAALAEAVARDTASASSHIMPLAEIARVATGMPDRLQAGFQYRSAPETEVEFPGLTVAIEDLTVSAVRGEFYAGLIPAGDVFTGYVEYSTDLWDRPIVEQWTDAYRELLREVTSTS